MQALDAFYRAYNRRAYVHPDPLETLYRYQDPRDQEIAGLVAACLAYGRVAQILSSVGRVLDAMGPSPRAFLGGSSERGIASAMGGIVHRFTTGRELADLLISVKRAASEHGSLEALFARGLDGGGAGPRDRTTLPALAKFVDALRRLSPGGRGCPSLLSSPDDGSACKRLNLYLRWMARRDAVDPGPWESVPPRLLVVPLDTHMFRIARLLGLTSRTQPNLKTAIEITEGFAAIRPRDPVRYDFALTRLGINPACREGAAGQGLRECLREGRQWRPGA